MPPDTDFTIVQAGRVVALAACILLGYGAYVIWLGVGTGAWFTLMELLGAILFPPAMTAVRGGP